jgi:hypothetical protein
MLTFGIAALAHTCWVRMNSADHVRSSDSKIIVPTDFPADTCAITLSTVYAPDGSSGMDVFSYYGIK